jgi:hypothetical protein
MDEFEPTVSPPPSPSFLAELTLSNDFDALAATGAAGRRASGASGTLAGSEAEVN